MDFLRVHQLDIMLVLSGLCAMLVVFASFTTTLRRKKKLALIFMELTAALLLIADRFAYIYRGNPTNLGYWAVRICNFVVFTFTLLILRTFNLYLVDLFTNEGKLPKAPKRLRITEILVWVEIGLIIISQFTGLYYYFDDQNSYHRSSTYFLSYIIPAIILFFQLSVILQYFKRINHIIRFSLLLFTTLPIIATIIQFFAYGISLTTIILVIEVIFLYVFVLFDLNNSVVRANKNELEFLKAEQKNMHIMFEQTAAALANAIDAKDKYTHGHSTRVAEYARKIAEKAGKSEKFCEEIYFAGLLHDVGKIGIQDAIINKEGKLTDEEFSIIKKHPVIGKQILSSISKSPYLSVAANFHHEKYNGRGYPEGLKGEDIPEIARIIAVADAYDAMTSKRSYRDPLPQQKVREEILKCMDTQFDPAFAKIMLNLIDLDTEYQLKESEEIKELAGKNELWCEEYRSSYSEGLLLNNKITNIKLLCQANPEFVSEETIPTIILFDSLDGRIHQIETKTLEMAYYEYATIRFDGLTEKLGARKIKSEIITNKDAPTPNWTPIYKSGIEYEIQAVKVEDHIQITIKNIYQSIKIIIALPDNTRFAYLGLTGEHCHISKVDIKKEEQQVDQTYIPRIAKKICYTNIPQGDVPNVQIDGWCSDSIKGIPVVDELSISFHTFSLQTARLIWHCPYIALFYADDQKLNGENYQMFQFIRLDGESFESDFAKNEFLVTKTEQFKGWDSWKEINKKGFDSTITVKRKGAQIFLSTENGGILIESTTTLADPAATVYLALTGDQCVLSNIRIQ